MKFVKEPVPHVPNSPSMLDVANLEKLAYYLASKTPSNFDMEWYRTSPKKELYPTRLMLSEYLSKYANLTGQCGTAGCAVGHGIEAGIPVREIDVDWIDYSENFIDSDQTGWTWCFSANWSDVDNTAFGAAKRIFYMLQHGTPNTRGLNRVSSYPFSDSNYYTPPYADTTGLRQDLYYKDWATRNGYVVKEGNAGDSFVFSKARFNGEVENLTFEIKQSHSKHYGLAWELTVKGNDYSSFISEYPQLRDAFEYVEKSERVSQL